MVLSFVYPWPYTLDIQTSSRERVNIFSIAFHVFRNLFGKICPLFGQILITCLKRPRASFSPFSYRKKKKKKSLTYVNRLYEEAKSKQVKNKVLGDLRNELKTIIENQFKESCHETSRQKQNNDDVISSFKGRNKIFEGGTQGKK